MSTVQYQPSKHYSTRLRSREAIEGNPRQLLKRPKVNWVTPAPDLVNAPDERPVEQEPRTFAKASYSSAAKASFEKIQERQAKKKELQLSRQKAKAKKTRTRMSVGEE